MPDRVMLDFTDASIWKSENNSPFEIAPGGHGLRVRLTTQPHWPNIYTTELPQDWSTHRFINFDVFLEGELDALAGIWLRDANRVKITHFFELTPGRHMLSVDLHEHCKESKIDLKNIVALCLFRGWPRWPEEVVMTFDNLRLSEQDQNTLQPPVVNQQTIQKYFAPPKGLENNFGPHKSPLIFNDGRRVTDASQWPARRQEILNYWHGEMGSWPELITQPEVETLKVERVDDYMQHTLRMRVGPRQHTTGYALVPDGKGPFPAVLVVFYDPERPAGIVGRNTRAFGYDLVKRGFVVLCVGEKAFTANTNDFYFREEEEPFLQPLSFLAYVAADCYHVLAKMPIVDPARIGVMGHSYGGKWAMFASCLYDKFAAGVWSDGGIVFDEEFANINYWEPWYLGRERGFQRARGVITPESPRTGAYKRIIESGHDLHELYALMAPRPFLVSGGSEDIPAR
jgi:hypothetical protein